MEEGLEVFLLRMISTFSIARMRTWRSSSGNFWREVYIISATSAAVTIERDFFFRLTRKFSQSAALRSRVDPAGPLTILVAALSGTRKRVLS